MKLIQKSRKSPTTTKTAGVGKEKRLNYRKAAEAMANRIQADEELKRSIKERQEREWSEKAALYKKHGLTTIFEFDNLGSLVIDNDGHISYERDGRIINDLSLEESVQWYQILEQASGSYSTDSGAERWFDMLRVAAGKPPLVKALESLTPGYQTVNLAIKMKLDEWMTYGQVAVKTGKSIAEVAATVLCQADSVCSWSTEDPEQSKETAEFISECVPTEKGGAK